VSLDALGTPASATVATNTDTSEPPQQPAARVAATMVRAGTLSSSRCFDSRTPCSQSLDDETLGGNGGQACDVVEVVL